MYFRVLNYTVNLSLLNDSCSSFYATSEILRLRNCKRTWMLTNKKLEVQKIISPLKIFSSSDNSSETLLLDFRLSLEHHFQSG